jgi:putative ABC transport system permease protein
MDILYPPHIDRVKGLLECVRYLIQNRTPIVSKADSFFFLPEIPNCKSAALNPALFMALLTDQPVKPNTMLKNYFIIAWRNLKKNKTISFLNIGGLAIGMAVAMLIGVWIWDELSFDRYNKNYDTIAQLARREMVNGEVFISDRNNHFPAPLSGELKNSYANLFKQVCLATEPGEQMLSVDDKMFSRLGMYVEPEFTKMFTLNILAGSTSTFTQPNSILLSKSLATAFFGDEAAVGKLIKLNNNQNVKVSAVYEDLPANNRFADIGFFCPWGLLVASNNNVRDNLNNWNNSSYHIFVQTADGISMSDISKRIKDIFWPKVQTTKTKTADEPTMVFLHPMKDWHLRSEWKNGVQAGGQIQLVKLFGIIGIFVLLLACINFMNLSTARSEKRAKEVGVRKTFGSLRGQLIKQFLSESLLIVVIAFVLSLTLVSLSLGAFNAMANKNIQLSFLNPVFWSIAVPFILITAFVSGCYPALYLSSFRPVKVLKGTFKAGRFAVIPRRLMTSVQFTVSIVLIVSTIVIYRQIEHAKSRPVGYDRNGLIRINMTTSDLNGKYDVLREALLSSGAAVSFAQSSSATTENNYFDDRFEWEGKDPNLPKMAFALRAVTWDFGKTVGWQFLEGRDFSRAFPTDNTAIILNETAVKYMGLRNPVGKQIRWNGAPFTVVGIIRDMVTESPYKPVQQSLFFMVPGIGPVITIKLNPKLSAAEALGKIEPIFKRLNPSAPFAYKFVDEEYARKFAAEERVGVLSGFFAILAIFISCLGIFGLASFVTQQRIKEVSMRKILGASVLNLWSLLTKEFVLLVLVSFVIAVPVANYLSAEWLQKFEYRIDLEWWIFLAAGLGALIITLLTASFHAFRAAMASPVKNLRSE